MRLMLVDDEIRVLEGLARVLRDRIDDIDIRCFTTGAAALEALTADPYDVLITDMHMPGMDGAQLLAKVHERCPDVVRMVLSGHMDEQLALKAVTHAHQFLLKPCNGEILEKAVARAGRLRDLLASPAVRAAVGSVDKLPVIPAIYTELSKKLNDPKAAVADIVAVVRRDPAVSAKTMQLASSALFAGVQQVTTLEAAVARLGLRTLQALMLMVAVFDQTRNQAARQMARSAHLEQMQERALNAARVVSAVARGNHDAFMAALLGDIGRLVLAMVSPDEYDVVEQRAAAGEPREAVEREVIGATHPEVGAYLLGLWGLPLSIVDAVRWHHEPTGALPEHGRLAALVHVAMATAEGAEPDVERVTRLLGADAEKTLAAARGTVT